jgi:hypothetical protein
LLIQI